jgi:4'-phosphopantetheinyl transferase EntD
LSGLEPGWMGSVLPAGAFWADVEDHGQIIVLRDAERDCVSSSGEKRLRDFTLGRDCAHRALQRLGSPASAIFRRDDGAPVWPAGIVGSITHTRGYAAAAVAPATRFLGIGIDAERVELLDDGVERRLFLAEELAGLESLSPEARAVAAMTLFSAKEAFFKACPPQAAVRGFREIQVCPDDDGFLVRAGTLQARGGSFVVDGLVVTAVAMPAA